MIGKNDWHFLNGKENLKRKLKKIMLFLKIVIVIFLIILPFLPLEERTKIPAYKKQATENAIEYIENKYGFTPKIKRAKCEEVIKYSIAPRLWYPLTGYVDIVANDGNRSFNIYISGKEVTEIGFDNYQYNEIKNDVEDILNNTLKTQSISYILSYGKFMDLGSTSLSSGNGLITEFYDKTNLSTITKNYDFYIVLEYIDMSFDNLYNFNSDNPPQKFISELDSSNILLLSYRSSEAYETAKNYAYIRNIVWSSENYILDDFRLLIKEYVKISDNKTEYNKFILNQIDDFYYILDNGTYANFTKTNINDATDFGVLYATDVKQIYNAYSLETDAEKIFLYIPINKLKISSDEISWGVQYNYENSEKHRLISDDIINESYLYARLSDSWLEDNIIITIYEYNIEK